jgi:GntR family transcriptional regulator
MSSRSAELPSQRVETDLRRRLNSDEWEHGAALPPVGELAAHYAVARNTVLKALRRLEADGLIRIVSNWGTFKT